MPFKDTKEGSTHHGERSGLFWEYDGKDSCYKCKMCGEHLWREGLTRSHLCPKGKQEFKEKADNNNLTNI